MVSKTVNGGFVVRGFESLPLRYSKRFASKRATAANPISESRGALAARDGRADEGEYMLALVGDVAACRTSGG
jgi:hypothetical protein